MARIVKKTKQTKQELPLKNSPLVEHPDLIYMIAPYVHPSGLVQLSRTCAAFRTVLRAKTSKHIWKAARGNVKPEGLPDCPEDMSEFAYEELVFGTKCQGCRLKRKTQKFSYEVGLRLCHQCWNGQRLVAIDDGDPLLKAVMYRIVTKTGYRNRRNPTDNFMINQTESFFEITFKARRDQLEELQAGLAAIQDEYEGEAREREEQAYLRRAEEACCAKKAHTSLLSEWLKLAKHTAY